MSETNVPTVWGKLRGRFLTQFPRAWLWARRREATREMELLKAKYDPLIKEANAAYEANNTVDTLKHLSEIQGEFFREKNEIRDATYALQDDILQRQARKLGIRIPNRPPKEQDSDENWMVMSGFWMLKGEAERKLRTEIREEQRARAEEWRKWTTLFFVIVGTVFAFLSYRTKQKQPDPCPVNYYRNDLGACVFALPAPVGPKATPQSAPPGPKPTEQTLPSRKPDSRKSNSQQKRASKPTGGS
jgi:hypothetical protein